MVLVLTHPHTHLVAAGNWSPPHIWSIQHGKQGLSQMLVEHPHTGIRGGEGDPTHSLTRFHTADRSCKPKYLLNPLNKVSARRIWWS